MNTSETSTKSIVTIALKDLKPHPLHKGDLRAVLESYANLIVNGELYQGKRTTIHMRLKHIKTQPQP